MRLQILFILCLLLSAHKESLGAKSAAPATEAGFREKFHAVASKDPSLYPGEWDQAVKQVVEHKSLPVLQEVLAAGRDMEPGLASSHYRFRLLDMLAARPDFVLSGAGKYFRGKTDCLAFWMTGADGLLPADKLKKAMAGAAASKDAYARAFVKRAREVSSGSQAQLQGCWAKQ